MLAEEVYLAAWELRDLRTGIRIRSERQKMRGTEKQLGFQPLLSARLFLDKKTVLWQDHLKCTAKGAAGESPCYLQVGD